MHSYEERRYKRRGVGNGSQIHIFFLLPSHILQNELPTEFVSLLVTDNNTRWNETSFIIASYLRHILQIPQHGHMESDTVFFWSQVLSDMGNASRGDGFCKWILQLDILQK